MFSLIALYVAYRRNAPVLAIAVPARAPVTAMNDSHAVPSARAA